MFCILPFEVDFYKKWGMDVDYVGNPLLDAVSAFRPRFSFLGDNLLENKKLVALLPGSRKQEVNSMLPPMLAVAANYPDYQFVIAGAPSFKPQYYAKFVENRQIPVVFDSTYDLLNNAQAAIVASGTATLETALFHVPQVVVYKGNPIFITVARIVVKTRFISLVNLIMDKLIVKELIQDDCSPQTIDAELDKLLKNKSYRQQMLDDYRQLDKRMGEPGASEHTANLIIKYTSQKLNQTQLGHDV